MSEYLARIEQVFNNEREFFNLRPVLERFDDGFVEVDRDSIGQHGTITITSIQERHKESGQIRDQRYCLINLDLAVLDRSMSGDCRIRANDFIAAAKYVDGSGIIEVIELPNQYNANNIAEWITEALAGIMVPLSQKVLLKDDDCLFGPFSHEKINDMYYKFSPNGTGEDPFILDKYLLSQVNDDIYTFDAADKQRYVDIYWGKERHIIETDKLPISTESIDCIDDIALKDLVSRLISRTAQTKKEKREIRTIITSLPNEELNETRRNRILRLAENGDIAEQIISNIPAILFENDDRMNELAERVLDNADYADKLIPFVKTKEGYQKLLEELENEKKHKEAELSKIQMQLASHPDNTSVVTNEEYAIWKQEKNELQKKIDLLEQKEKIVFDIDELERQREQAQNQYSTLIGMQNSITDDISKKVSSAYTSFAFDGAIANLMLQEAAKFERLQKEKDLHIQVKRREEIETNSINSVNELIDYIYTELNESAKRIVSRNEVANVLLCISQGFLTVFAGEPGTGKTSLVNIIATALGLTQQNNIRFSEVAVEKGWTSRRDLLGYYNPLTKEFDIANRGLFDAFELLNEEHKQGIADFPYFVLLDEANLSPMEHYWADFMGICDYDKQNRSINLSENHVFAIPETLRFMATINLDHTTEVLSPRLIDRAWIIMMKSIDIDLEEFEDIDLKDTYLPVPFDLFKKLAMPTDRKIETSLTERFERVRSCFKKAGINFSPRLIGMIKRYCLAGKGIFDTNDTSYVALDFAVAQKLLPLINGYGTHYEEFLKELASICDQASMPVCYDEIQRILKTGQRNMQNYQFFSR